MTTRVSSPSRVASPPAAISPFTFMRGGRCILRPSYCQRGVRSSSQNDELDRRADPEREDERADPDGAAEREAEPERRDLDRRPRDADPDAEPTRDDEHQRVARARADGGADVEGRADAEEQAAPAAMRTIRVARAPPRAP